MLFLEAIEKYKKQATLRERIEVAKQIFDTFIDDDAPFPLNLSKDHVDAVLTGKTSGAIDVFDKCAVEAKNALYEIFKKWQYGLS